MNRKSRIENRIPARGFTGSRAHGLTIPLLAAYGLLLTISCESITGSGEGLNGLAKARDGSGVKIAWEPLAKPDARIPFPNNVLTRSDLDSPTGLRLNLPLDATTELENSIRRGLNELDGFGTYSFIRVPFEGPIDVTKVVSNPAHPGDWAGPNGERNTLFLIRIDEMQAAAIDLGENIFPYDAKGGPEVFWANDPLREWPSFLFHPFNRAYFKRAIDPARKAELKSMLESGQGAEVDATNANRLEYFEYETNTLLFRPIEPLVEKTTYAVILTNGILDLDGRSIRSPFPDINHVFQNEALRPVWNDLGRFGLTEADVAFMWIFTAQCVSCDLVNIRRGLDGEGPFAHLQRKFPARILNLYDLGVREPTNPRDVKLLGFADRPGLERDENPYTLDSAFLSGLISDVFNGSLQALVEGAIGGDVIPLDYQASFHNVAYSVFGSFISPSLVENERGLFTLNAATGEIDARMMDDPWDGDPGIPFMINIPKPTQENACGPPPYPVVIYGHGNTASSFTALFQANYLARYCIATAALDYYGHGPLFDLFNLFEKIPESPTLDDLAVALEPFGVDPEELGNVAGIDVKSLVPVIGTLAAPVLNDSLFPMAGVPEDYYTVVDPETGARKGKEYAGVQEVAEALKGVGLFKALLFYGRSHDTNGDGVRDQGDSFFDINILKTRDHFRQSAVDAMQFARVIKGFCRDHDGNGKLDLKEGDFNGDGVCDVGGPDNEIFYTSTSLGGIIGSILTGVDPLVTRSALTVPGGGLSDVLARTTLGSVAKRVYFGIVGATIVGRPVLIEGTKSGEKIAGKIGISVNDAGGKGATVKLKDLACEVKEDCLLPIEDGHQVLIRNLRSGEERLFRAGPNSDDPAWDFPEGGNFSGRVAADPGDRIVVAVPGPDGGSLTLPETLLPQDVCRYVRDQNGWPCATFVIRKGQEGLGTDRNSPHLTFLLSIAQTALDSADPVNYAPFYNVRPMPDVGPKKVVIQVSTGDLTVPINTGVALGRAAGYVTHEAHRAFVEAELAFGKSEALQACMVLDPGAVCDSSTGLRAPTIEAISWTRETTPSGRHFSGFRPYNANEHAWYLLPIPFEDLGTDKISDTSFGTLNSQESDSAGERYNPFDHPDPSNDNYCPDTNPNGTEGNRRLDTDPATGADEDQTVDEPHMKGNGYLDIDYTQAAQQQAGILFRYGFIRNITPVRWQQDPASGECECMNPVSLEPLQRTDSFATCSALGGHMACITNPMCPGFGAPPWWP